MLLLILIIILVLGVGGVGPWWGYSRGWGYAPGGIIGLILVVFIILYLTGHRF